MKVVTWALYNSGLRIYSDGKHVATVPTHKLKFLLAEIAKGLAYTNDKET